MRTSINWLRVADLLMSYSDFIYTECTVEFKSLIYFNYTAI